MFWQNYKNGNQVQKPELVPFIVNMKLQQNYYTVQIEHYVCVKVTIPVNWLLTNTQSAIPVVRSSSQSIGALYNFLKTVRRFVSNKSGKWQ